MDLAWVKAEAARLVREMQESEVQRVLDAHPVMWSTELEEENAE
jgi:hypothetical protein